MFAEIATLLVKTLFSLVTAAFLLRMMLQLAKADFYNPICQFIVNATNWAVLPLRRALPSLGPIDTSSLFAAFVLQLVAMVLLLLSNGYELQPLGSMMTWAILNICSSILSIYFWALLIGIILSWIAPDNYHPGIALIQQLTEPMLAPLRKLIPPAGGLDFTPIIAFLLLQVLRIVIDHASAAAQLPLLLSIGF